MQTAPPPVGHNRGMSSPPGAPSVLSLRVITCVLVWALLTGDLHAQQSEDTLPVYAPATGDAWIDRHLADINNYAARHPQAFADDLSRYYQVPRGYVLAMLQQPAWRAGDVFFACALAQRLVQPCRAVVREWSRDHADGWAVVAERLQPDPDATDFGALREDLTASYRRWARPLRERQR